MSNNLTRKGLAVSSGLAIALTSLVGAAPAQAAGNYIDMQPSSGEIWSVFNTDDFSTEVEFPFEGANFGVALTNSSGQAFELDEDADDFDVAYAVTATGAIFDVYDEINEDDIVDFDALNAVRVHLGYYNDSWDQYINVQPLVFDADEDTSDDVDEYVDDYRYASWGDGDFSVGLQVWRESGDKDNSFLSIEAALASAVETVRFFDPSRVVATPRIERFSSDGDGWVENEYGEDLGFSVLFSKAVNLDLIDEEDWDVRLVEGDYDGSWEYFGYDAYEIGLYGDDQNDDRNRLYAIFEYEDMVDGAGIQASTEYRIDIAHGDAPGDESGPDRFFSSNVFELDLGSADADDVVISVTPDADSNLDEDASEIELRPGVKTFTFSAQLQDGGEDLAEADVPVLFTIYYVNKLANGATISSTGANYNVKSVDNEILAYGLTDEDGQVSFTVTHSSATSTEEFAVEAYWYDELGQTNSGDYYDVTYATATPSEIEADATIAGGAKVNVAFTVTDQFGQPVSKSGTKALSVLLSATDTDELELAAAVDANGRASFTFDNYLEVGATDLLFAEVITGTVTDPTPVGPQTEVELYNSPAANSVSVAKNATANVTYQDFLTGAGSASKNAAMTAVATTYTGTVLDANGAGIPGAVVKVAGTGFLFRNTGVGNYFENSIDVVADNNGKFSVDFWVHEANATGKTLTVTSGGKTATTTVKTYLPTGLDGNNLKFELVMPKNVVKNTTYALVAKLTDKWGNPVATSTSGDKLGVTFQGLGSVEINSSASEVERNFTKDGTATVYLRSVKDIAGPGTVTASLGEAAYKATSAATSTALDIDEVATDATSTVWDETKFTNVIEVDVEVLNAAPASGKVNVGSFNGKLVVYASGLQGSTISWKVGGVWGKQVATSNFARFDRPTPRRGVTVTVDIYVNGVKQLTKSVVTR